MKPQNKNSYLLRSGFIKHLNKICAKVIDKFVHIFVTYLVIISL